MKPFPLVLNLTLVPVLVSLLTVDWAKTSYSSAPVIANADAETTTDVVDSLKQRIIQLEWAIAPQTPEQAAETWARGIQSRNGALQFAMLSSELQQALKSDYSQTYWVTGVSSPWVDRYTITDRGQDGDIYLFEIEYGLMSSTGPEGTFTQELAVQFFPVSDDHAEGWYITEYSPSPNSLQN